MPLFGHFPFWLPTRFSEVIHPRYDPDLIEVCLNAAVQDGVMLSHEQSRTYGRFF